MANVRVLLRVGGWVAVGLSFGCGRAETAENEATAPPDAGADVENPPVDAPGGDVDADLCVPGQSVPCYSSPEVTRGVGLCQAGLRTCLEDGSAWGDCAGEIEPANEDCATPFDDDCDGEVNEADAGCGCAPGEVAECYGGPGATLGVGVCHSGVQVCNASGTGWGACAGQVLPVMEDCPSLDDEDCDGSVNEDGLNCVCQPGTSSDCYSGPPGTEWVGNCGAGLRACQPDGVSFGPCIGEVVPASEDCDGSWDDEDCDGETNEDGPSCLCVPLTAGPSCYTGAAGTAGVGTCIAGKQYCEDSGLSYYPTCDGEITPVLENCALDTDEDCDGSSATDCAQLVWSKVLPKVQRIHLEAHGALSLAGSASLPTDFGGGTLPSGGDLDAWVVRFGADGQHLWSRRFPGPGMEDVLGLAVGPAGELVLVGRCTGPSVFDAVELDCKQKEKVLAVRVDSGGVVQWAKSFGDDASAHYATAVDIDANGAVVISGLHHGTIDFGGGPLASAGPASMFLAKLDAAGHHVFSKSFPHPTLDASMVEVITTSTNDVLVAGTFGLSFDLGGGPLAAFGSATYLAGFTATGQHVWSTAYQTKWHGVSRMRADAAGSIVLAGTYSGTEASFGGPSLPILGSTDPFVVKLTSNATHVWSHAFLNGSGSDVYALSIGPTGNLAMGGSGLYMDFGFGEESGNAGFLIGLGADGSPRWQYPSTEIVRALSHDAADNLYVAGLDFLWKLAP